jgi:ABC-type iron transport system FetAB ATPase subunit
MDQPIDPTNRPPRRGLLIVLSSPSGAGKSTISRMLLEADPEDHHVGLGDDPAQAAGRASTTSIIISSTMPSSTA